MTTGRRVPRGSADRAFHTRCQMPTPIEAIYEHGVLRLTQPIDLAEGTRVEVIVIPQASRAEPSTSPGSQPRKRTPNEILDELAAMSVPSDRSTDDALNHDRILYGEDLTG